MVDRVGKEVFRTRSVSQDEVTEKNLEVKNFNKKSVFGWVTARSSTLNYLYLQQLFNGT
jgi:hypothetical protein